MTSADVMDRAAALMNDTNKNTYSYIAQLPYLNIAIDELSELMELNNVPTTNAVSASLHIAAGVVTITSATTPALPTDLIEIQQLWEKTYNVTEDWQGMSRVEFLPKYSVLLQNLIYWTWQQQAINFLGATTDRDVKIDYIARAISNVSSTTGADTITTFNAKSFLAYRTASLCAEYIDADEARASALAKDAVAALDRTLNISIKGRQAIATRRRPFMAAYKLRSGF